MTTLSCLREGLEMGDGNSEVYGALAVCRVLF